MSAAQALVAEFARRLVPDGLAVGTSGNLSIRDGDAVAVSPTGVAYDEVAPGDVSLVDLDGALLAGAPPSSELPLHLEVYRRTAAGAVVHTHAPYATALGAVCPVLPPIHYLIADLGGPVPVVPYATPGSVQLGASVAGAVAERSAALLANHGTVTVGPTLSRAYARSVLLEWLCALYHRARMLGEPTLIADDELARMRETMGAYFDRSVRER